LLLGKNWRPFAIHGNPKRGMIMRLRTCTLLALVASFLASGCASLAPQASVDDDIDHAKVAAIERIAIDRGVKVYWLNYPRKRSS
jgi:hypothetical protein